MKQIQLSWIRSLYCLSVAGGLLIAAPNLSHAQRRRAAQAKKPAGNVRFEQGNQVMVPADFVDNMIILRVRVNDSEPLKFIFDTGAGMSVLDVRKAKALHLKKVANLDANGVGGTVQGFLATGVSLSVPGVTVRNQKVAAIPLDFPCEAADIVGIIGYDFINEFVVEIDYEAKTLGLFDPASYSYSGRGDVVPLTMIDNTPHIRARLGVPGGTSVEGLLEVDTGSDGTLSINTPFVKKHGLIERFKTRFDSSHRGVGGESASVDVRMGDLELGRFTIPSPVVSLALDRGDSSNDAGPLGNEILRRFRIVFDYSRERMTLEPNAHLSDPIETGMSGINFDTEDCRPYKVKKVEDNSPAAEAGIKAGDEVVAIDGRAFKEIRSFEMEKLFTRNGAEYELTISRAGKTQTVKIKLRRLL